MTKKTEKSNHEKIKLKNKFLKTRNGESKECFNRQINFCVGLLRKNKTFFWILDHRVISDNRKFWETILSSRRLFTKNLLF